MKHKLYTALVAMAVLGLSACVEQVNVNPSFDPETNTVNTTFVLNIAAADTEPQTKQTGENTQTNKGTSGLNNFRGIENATMFAFKVPNTGDKVMPTGTGDEWGNSLTAIDLSSALTESAIGDGGDKKSHRVMEIPIPLETNALIFYGMASRGTKSEKERGSMSYIFPDYNIAHIGSYANARLTDVKNYERVESIIEAIYNHMLRVGLGGSHPWDSVKIKSETYKDKHVIWADYLCCVEKDATGKLHSPLDPNKNPSPLGTILGTTYQALTTIKGGEARAGSGASLARETYDLSFVMADIAGATATSEEEEVAIQLAQVLQQYMGTFGNVNGTWKSISEVWTGMDANHYNFQTGLVAPEGTSYNLQDFPNHFNLPMGASILSTVDETFDTGTKYERTLKQFRYSDSPNLEKASDYVITDITYTPELCYYGNSPLRISDDGALAENDYPDGTGNWSSAGNWGSKWKSGFGSVTTSTRGVAMAYNIQYGMALMSTTVQYDLNIQNESTVILKDNNAALHPGTGVQDQDIPITGNTPITLKGIMIGGQPCPVGWGYLPWTSYSGSSYPGAPEKFTWNRMVYDNDMAAKNYGNTGEMRVPLTGVSNPNYTILFDNYNDKGDQNKVFISLEFVNHTGHDFWGQHNMVRSEGTFYLVAELNPALGGDVTWPEDYDEMMPPYDAAGKTIRTKRVFMQDYITHVTITLGKDALKRALVTVPDLRAAKLSVGLSVDLNWKQGITYAVGL